MNPPSKHYLPSVSLPQTTVWH
ncbi:hypothetical protein E2C01_045391 [Portunus trituberculatus]|uniref:Uncharacterized protein n=1 Tax=Portunus trituberculatus TaxID=210409 RepID=A0A5B7G2R1_PORTR|nr:hypothetical protein [Portunus trituberculatus]